MHRLIINLWDHVLQCALVIYDYAIITHNINE